MLAAGSKGATQSEILNKESFLTLSRFRFICFERPVC